MRTSSNMCECTQWCAFYALGSAGSHFSSTNACRDAGDALSSRVNALQAYCYIKYMNQSLKIAFHSLDL